MYVNSSPCCEPGRGGDEACGGEGAAGRSSSCLFVVRFVSANMFKENTEDKEKDDTHDFNKVRTAVWTFKTTFSARILSAAVVAEDAIADGIR